MRNHIAAYLDNAITVLLLVVAGLTPLLFLNQTTEFYELPKLAFLIISTAVLLGLWIFSWIVKGKISITRTPLDFPLIIMLVVVLVSTYFSASRYPAIYGNFPNVHGSAVAWVTYILLYFITVSHLKNLNQIKTFLYVLYGSGIIVAFISLLSYFHLYLPFDFARAANFTPTGSSFSTISFLLLLLPFPLLTLINPNKYLSTPAAITLAVLFSITITLLGSIPTYVALIIAFALCFFVSKPNQVRRALPMFLIPVIATALVLVLSYMPLPGGLGGLQQLQANFPKEIQLPLGISWKISASAFRDAPFIGTGPSSYLFNFTTYKPAEFNLLQFWNFSFNTAYDEFLQVLGTLGIFGLLAIVFFCIVVFISSWRNLSVAASEHHEENAPVLLPALAISGLLTIVLLAIHATTLVSIVMTFFILAALMMSQRQIRERVMELSMGLKATTAGNRQFDLFPVIIFIVFIIAVVPVLFRTFNAVAADFYHRKALSQANKSGTATYQYLQKAESLNPRVDLYRIDMAQTNFALANAIAAKAQPTNGQKGAALSDQDKKTIQTLLSQAINEGRVAVALSPRSAANWEVLAAIYRNITGVAQNALSFSLDGYGRAIQRDPLNPALRVSVGGIYYSIKNYDLATRFFSDAANLKPDYANAYYNLSIALRDKGDYTNAALIAQQTVNLLSKTPNSPDYKTATKLLEDLKAKVAAGQQQNGQNGQGAPAGQTNNALNGTGVNVPNLNNPPQVATPSAVKANPSANLPQAESPKVAPTR